MTQGGKRGKIREVLDAAGRNIILNRPRKFHHIVTLADVIFMSPHNFTEGKRFIRLSDTTIVFHTKLRRIEGWAAQQCVLRHMMLAGSHWKMPCKYTEC